MDIGVKVLEAPIAQTSYIRATIKGMARTFKHLVDPHKGTVEYPSRRSASAALARDARMLTTEDGNAKCVACGLCPSICPATASSSAGEVSRATRYPPWLFEIDDSAASSAAYCQEVCPEEAIHGRSSFREIRYSREDTSTSLSGSWPDAPGG